MMKTRLIIKLHSHNLKEASVEDLKEATTHLLYSLPNKGGFKSIHLDLTNTDNLDPKLNFLTNIIEQYLEMYKIDSFILKCIRLTVLKLSGNLMHNCRI